MILRCAAGRHAGLRAAEPLRIMDPAGPGSIARPGRPCYTTTGGRMTSDQAGGFADRLHQLRQRRGLSLRQLAALVHHGKSYLHELGTGAKVPTPAVARRLDSALGGDGSLMRFVCPPMDADFEAHPPAEVEPGQPMGVPDLESLHGTVRHLVTLDTAHGSEGLHCAAVRAFRNASRRLTTAGAQAGLRGDIHAAVAEVGEVAAWLAYDSDRQDLSRRVATEALLIAQLAGDTSMSRFLMSHLSMQAVYAGRGSEGLELAEQVIAEEPRSGRVVGMMLVRRARALGQLGDTSRALAELERARGHLAGGIGPEDPPWTWWLHTAELAVHEARIRSAGGDSPGAVHAGESSVLHLPAGQGRDQALYRAWLVSDLVDVRAWLEADRMLSDLMARAPAAGSARVPRILRGAEKRSALAGAPGWLTDALRDAAEAMG